MHLTRVLVLLVYAAIAHSAFAASTKAKVTVGRIAELEAECQQAREARLTPERAALIEECAAKKHNDRAYCERFYVTHGDATAARAPLYVDLPECVEAHEFKSSNKKR